MKVLLIGLDGATFSILDPLMEDGVMPCLSRFLQQGVRAELRSVVPALTPPAWTSLATGRSPGVHGIFDFFRMEPSEGRHIQFVSSKDVACATIWSIASANGLKVGAMNFPLMYPPPPVSGYVIPGWVPWKMLRLACHPRGLFERLKSIPGLDPREMAMDIKLEEKATEGCREGEYGPWVELHIRREENWFKAFSRLSKEEGCRLEAVLFDGIDKLQHLCWRFIDPNEARRLKEDWELQVREGCLEYFRRLDGIIGEMCRMAGPQASVFLASDHGFGPTAEVFHLNAFLEQKGYLAWKDAAQHQPDSALLGVGQVARHTFLLDWRRTVAFATTPTSNGVHILVNSDGKSPGIPPGQYDSFCSRLIEELGRVCSPSTGEPVVERVWRREEAFEGPCMSLAPDLTLTLRDGGLVSILPSRELVKRRPQLAGTHRPLGVFAARGPGIRQGFCCGELSILDVAPALLHALGLPVPSDFEGRVPEEIFESEALRRRPVETGPPACPGMPSAADEERGAGTLGPEEEELLLDRMRGLGYIE